MSIVSLILSTLRSRVSAQHLAPFISKQFLGLVLILSVMLLAAGCPKQGHKQNAESAFFHPCCFGQHCISL